MASNPHVDGEPMNPKHAADLAFDMTFGCQTLVTGLFKTQLADGIMGMSNQMSTFWSQMFRAEKMGDEQKFALCFSRPPLIKREGTEAGAMTLGGYDERLHSSPMVYTPDFDKGRSSFFSVKVRSMMLRDGKFGMSAKSTSKNPNEGVKHLQLDESVLNKGGIIVLGNDRYLLEHWDQSGIQSPLSGNGGPTPLQFGHFVDGRGTGGSADYFVAIVW